jgi:hypothetical protein
LVSPGAQPVTIEPKVVPVDGQRVVLTSPVHVRAKAPSAPNYNVDSNVNDTLGPKASVIVLRKASVIASEFPGFLIVWAEVSY